jgi:histidinol-phosphate/aromatic aminotransferase/cobyric acid decarboxylase-like protein/choline kinase
MQAVILAAGMGRRLGELTKNNTKCMIKVHDKTLIERMMSQLATHQLSRIVIVIGYFGEQVKELIGENYKGTPVVYIENPVYDKTNNIYSLYLAKEYLQEEDTILLESDLIVEDAIIERLLLDPSPNLAVVSKYQSWMDGTVMLLDDDDNILGFVPKQSFNYSQTEHYYKTVNIYKFSKEFCEKRYIPFLEAYSKAFGNNEYYEQVLRVITLIDSKELKALRLTNEVWYEIDDLQDLHNAETLFAEDDVKSLQLFQSRYGGYWRFPKIKDFCYLVNSYFPPEMLKEELKASSNILLTEYPSGLTINCMLAAKMWGLQKEQIIVGNGAAELIKAMMETTTLTTGIIFPTFEEYPNRADGGRMKTFIPANADYTYTVEELIEFSETIDQLLLINPDNPSGHFIPKSDILRLLDVLKEKGKKLILDESFVDFTNEGKDNSFLEPELIVKYPNLVIIKSISKSYGVPGIRLGIMASSDEKLINEMKQAVSIWNINSYAEFFLQIIGKYEAEYLKGCKDFVEERERFYAQLSAVPYLRVIPSQANYFLCEVLATHSSTQLATDLLKQYNILIKDCSEKKAFEGKQYIRIAVRDTFDNTYLSDALQNLRKN